VSALADLSKSQRLWTPTLHLAGILIVNPGAEESEHRAISFFEP
jgi:hypothetical protein